jgi:hypothetical protein
MIKRARSAADPGASEALHVATERMEELADAAGAQEEGEDG